METKAMGIAEQIERCKDAARNIQYYGINFPEYGKIIMQPKIFENLGLSTSKVKVFEEPDA